jgi:hypothetical protein
MLIEEEKEFAEKNLQKKYMIFTKIFHKYNLIIKSSIILKV